ncbi:MAG: SIS domain-containing protein [Acidobacteriales bacterium]|nr:SIS domain-containing protein [Terriglobales bacterium]
MSIMIQEIEEQPATLERTWREEFRRIERFRRVLERRRPSLIVLVARGTSDNAALFGRYLLEMTTGIPVSLAAPSLLTLYHAPMRWEGALVVGVSQSGESTDTNLFLEAAGKGGALTVGVTNEAASSITRLVDEVFLVRAGKERSVAATKTYTGQLLMMYLLAYALGAPLDPRRLERLPALAARALRLKPAISRLAERYRYMDHAVVVGRGLNYANAFEFSLKLMETCYVVAERFSGADFLHGPIALVERAFPVFLFAPPGPTWEATRAILEKLRGLEAETVVISDAGNTPSFAYATRSIRVPGPIPATPGSPADLFTPIPYIVPAQLFAATLAAQKGLNPDRPRTLTKITKTV